MLARSARSTNCDAWRAGFEVGEVLAPGNPEVVLLFCSVHYEENFPDLLEGLSEGLGQPDPRVFGCSGDAVFESDFLMPLGIAALGLNGEAAVKWAVAAVPDAGTGREAAVRCGRELAEALGGEPDLAFVLADSTHADGAQVVEGAREALACPLLGGLAGDDRRFRRSYLLARGRAWQDAVVMLGARGALDFALHSASGFRPVGEVAQVEESEGNEVRRIGGHTAQGFLQEQLGKTPGEGDLGVTPLALNPAGGHFLLRTAASLDLDTGTFRAFGAVPQGAEVQACAGTAEEVLEGARQVVDRTRAACPHPAAALVISCAGRRWLLGDRFAEEARSLRQGLGGEVPLVGFCSLGEIGPFREEPGGHSPPHFHNATVVLGLFGG